MDFPGWLCVVGRMSFHNGNPEAYYREMRSIFGDDLLDLKFAYDGLSKSSDEFYSFLRCANYESHSADLAKSVAVVRVVPSVRSPQCLSDAEVAAFLKDLTKPLPMPDIEVGDVVRVQTGYMDGLYGIVTAEKRGRFRVFFRFYMREFYKTYSRKHLHVIAKANSARRPSHAVEVCGETDRVCSA